MQSIGPATKLLSYLRKFLEYLLTIKYEASVNFVRNGSMAAILFFFQGVNMFLHLLCTFLDRFGRNLIQETPTYSCLIFAIFEKIGSVKAAIFYGRK